VGSRFALIVLGVVGVVVIGVSVVWGAGVELAYVGVSVASQYFGSYMVFLVPFNVSSPDLLSFQNLYVLKSATGQPLYSYLFSPQPPLVVFLEPSVGNTFYGIYYGGTNPFQAYVALPGSPQSLFFLYDDFDYDSGMWSGSYKVYSSRMEVTGFVASNRSFSGGYSFISNILGGRALAIVFNISSGWVTSSLNASTFTDWASVLDGNDIFFLDPSGRPTNYSIISLDKANQILNFAVYLNSFNTVYMLYGGANPYASYRVQPS